MSRDILYDEVSDRPPDILEDREDDEECDLRYTKRYTNRLREKNPRVKFTVSSEINKKLLQKKTWKYDKSPKWQLKSVKLPLASATASGSGLIGMIDTLDRPADASAEGTYARRGSYAEGFENKPGKRIPRAGLYAEAGVGRASAEVSVLRVEARGPNASAGAEVTAARLGVGAMAHAEVASASASVGPVDVKLGLGVDTGGYIGVGGVEAKVLGWGFSLGQKTGISIMGSELSFTF